MKKSTIETMIAYLNGAADVDVAELAQTLTAELNHINEKRDANRALYSSAADVIMPVMTSEPQTAQQIYDACAADLPDGFTLAKLRYWLRTTEGIISTDVGKIKGYMVG